MRDKNEAFGWMLVGQGGAIMIGTWYECARYQLKHGLRASTQIL